MKGLRLKYGLLAFCSLLLVLCTLLGILFTQGRYEEEVSSGSDIYDGELEYIVAEQVLVNNVEELIAAIENGYSNIQIAEGVDNPLIITSGVTDVGADLILDLNGHEIQRNNRDPMLNIENGVRLTIIDTSASQGGSFYNPVGSVLRIGGGTLTVSAGAFVSGPKASEYAAPVAGGGWSAAQSGKSGGTIGAQTVTADLYLRNAADPEQYNVFAGQTLPFIAPSVSAAEAGAETGEGRHWFVNGNMYFDEGAQFGEGQKFSGAFGDLLQEDLYLYHVINDDSVGTTTIAAEKGADFRYSYEVLRTVGEGGAPQYAPLTEPVPEGGQAFTVNVYGYYGVKAQATDQNNYATVEMRAGNMYARGGSYATYFGTADSYGIYASGGYMAAEEGTVFDAVENGVCIRCRYEAESEHDYLRVSGGKFSSDNGDTVRVDSGRMVVTGGSFRKDDTDPSADADAAAGEAGYLGAAIRVDGGDLSASGAQERLQFELSGSSQYGVYVRGGEAEVANADFTFAGGSNNVGVYAASPQGGRAAQHVSLRNIDITVPAKESSGDKKGSSGNYGVNAAADIDLQGQCSVAVEGADSVGLVAQGGSINYQGGSGKKLYVKMDMGAETTLNSTAVAAIGGNIVLNGEAEVWSNGLGVAVWEEESGTAQQKLELQSGSLTITSTRATALYVAGGDVTFAEDTAVSIASTIDESVALSWNEDGTPAATMYNGVFVQGGQLLAEGATFNVTHTGISNVYQTEEGAGSNSYADLVVRSYAVRVQGAQTGQTGESEVFLTDGVIRNTEGGGGLYVSNGTVTLGGGTLSVSSEGSGYDENGGWLMPPGGAGAWAFHKNTTGGHAVEVVGGSLTINGGAYSANMGNGILVHNGTAKINGGTFIGADAYAPNGESSKATAGPAASYAFKMYGGSVQINGGVFTDPYTHNGKNEAFRRGSGAFVMGSSAEDEAVIEGAVFEVGGTAAFAVYSDIRVVFGEENGEDGAVSLSGESAAITVEDTAGTSPVRPSSVTVYSGTYVCNTPKDGGGSDGIYYGEETTALSIYGGVFSGVGTEYNAADGAGHTAGRSGLYFAVDPGANVKLYGGTFIGGTPEDASGKALWGAQVYCYREGGGISCQGNTEGTQWTNSFRYEGVEIGYGDLIDGKAVRGGNTWNAQNSYPSTVSGSVHEDFAQYRVIRIS